MIKKRFNVVVDGQAGSCGKGLIASYLAWKHLPEILTTTNMANAGHTAVNSDGRSFVAKALPSPTALSKWYPDYNPTVVVGASAAFSLEQLLKEVAECELPADRLKIHPRAGVITDAHRLAEGDLNTGTKHIASTMQGCGTFLADKIMRRPGLKLARDYPGLSSYVLPEHDQPGAVNLAEWLHDRLTAGSTILHEGSQGFSLDINHGSSYPACTSRGTSAVQNLADMGLPVRDMGDVYLVIRPYPIKVGHVVEDGVVVGHSGGHYPDQEELTWEYVAEQAGMPAEAGLTEYTTVTGRLRRCFSFSKTQLRQAALVNGATRIALNFANYIDYAVAGVNSVEGLTPKVNDFIKMVEDLTGVPVTLIGTGPRIDQVVDLE